MANHATVRNLLDRNGRYFARLIVPAPLRPIIGKRELLTPLGGDRTKAIRALPRAVGEMHGVLDVAREALKPPRRTRLTPNRAMTDRTMAMAHYESEIVLDTAERAYQPLPRQPDATEDAATAAHQPHIVPPADPSIFRPAFEVALKNVASGRFSNEEGSATVGWILDGFHARGVPVPEVGTTEWRERVRVLAGVQLEILKRSAERDAGDFAGEPTHPALVAPAANPSDPLLVRNISPDSAKPLSELQTMMLGERQVEAQTKYEYEVICSLFEQFIGEEKPAYRITRQDIHAFKRMLGEMPKNATKMFPDKPILEAIAANKKLKRPLPGISAKTGNKYLAKLSTLMGWCVRNDILPDNPAAGIKFDVQRDRGKPPRIPFSGDDLKMIFAPAVFAAPYGEPEWARVISLYTGMRASELAQIKLTSVREERGILVFAVEEQTKNMGSQRLIPVHQKLIDLGLKNRVAQLKKQRQTHLFPRWFGRAEKARRSAEKSGTVRMTNLFFPRYIPRAFIVTFLPSIGIKDSRKTWHSWRHTFKTGLAHAGVERSIQDQLCGHADNTAGGLYIHGVSLEALKKSIDKVSFL